MLISNIKDANPDTVSRNEKSMLCKDRYRWYSRYLPPPRTYNAALRPVDDVFLFRIYGMSVFGEILFDVKNGSSFRTPINKKERSSKVRPRVTYELRFCPYIRFPIQFARMLPPYGSFYLQSSSREPRRKEPHCEAWEQSSRRHGKGLRRGNTSTNHPPSFVISTPRAKECSINEKSGRRYPSQ
jgi:hypothetical protein